jgi:hypothetical protein
MKFCRRRLNRHYIIILSNNVVHRSHIFMNRIADTLLQLEDPTVISLLIESTLTGHFTRSDCNKYQQ